MTAHQTRPMPTNTVDEMATNPVVVSVERLNERLRGRIGTRLVILSCPRGPVVGAWDRALHRRRDEPGIDGAGQIHVLAQQTGLGRSRLHLGRDLLDEIARELGPILGH